MNDPREFLKLKPGWDSYGGRPATEEAVRTAENLTYVPSSNGGISIELHAGGSDVEIEIGPDGKVETVMWGRQGML